MADFRLEPHALIFALHHGDGRESETYRGEIRADIDGEDTAFIMPCNRIRMDNHICELLRIELEPLGVTWIRWWDNGQIVGYSFEGAL